MKEIYDPVYYPPNIQGFDDTYQHQQYLQQYHQQQSNHRPSSSKASSSSSVLGRFLKLGKSKSDASLGNNGGFFSLSTSASASAIGGGNGGGGGDDDFRLPSSVIARHGPVEKMVHKANSRKDVSRSHSWIYGSVKLPSDLPFGYGDQFSYEGEGDGGGQRNSGQYLHNLHSMQIPRCQLDYYCTCDGGGDGFVSPSGRPIAGGSVRAGGLRKGPCQGCMAHYALPPTGKRKDESFVSSVRKLTWKSLKQVVKKRPSLDTLKKSPQHPQVEYSAPVPMPYLSPSAVAAASATSAPLSPVNANPMANLVNYQSGHYGHSFPHNNPPPSAMTSNEPPDEDNNDPANYFFPEKKGFYASCNDIYGGDPHVTASVRVRPKRTRQPWQFPDSELGPVPNYEEDLQETYHSEWDLRNVMSYDVWMNTTSNVKPRPGPSNGGSVSSKSGKVLMQPSPSERHPPSHSLQNLHVPPPDYTESTFRPQQQKKLSQSRSSPNLDKLSSSSSSSTLTNSSVRIAKTSPNSQSLRSSTSLHSPSIVSTSSAASSTAPKRSALKKSKTDTLNVKTNTFSNPKPKNVEIVKRSSILATDVNAYQLLKAQKKESVQSSSSSVSKSGRLSSASTHSRRKTPEVEAFSESSDDLSDNAVSGSTQQESESGKNKNGVRLAGQGIRMAVNTKNTKPKSTSPSNNVNKVQSRTPTNNQNKNQRVPKKIIRQGSTSSTSEEEVWSDCHTEQERKMKGKNMRVAQVELHHRPQNKHVSSTSSSLNRELSSAKSSNVKVEKASVPAAAIPRPSLVTFEAKKNNAPPQKQFDSKDMDFEEFEFKEKGDREPQMKANKTPTPANLKASLANLKSTDKDNVVSLNVTRSPTANEKNSASPQPHPTYVKHTKSQSSVAATGKFGALRRRKSRSNGTNPGKLLQETIYEEETEHIEGDSSKAPEHSVKIMINSGTNNSGVVKPILKNRTYETPVNNVTVQNNNTCDSTNPTSQAPQISSSNSNEIYFESSISTVSTTSKKKVQFDQSPEVVVCGDSSSQDSFDDDSDQWSNKSDDEVVIKPEVNNARQSQPPQPPQQQAITNGNCQKEEKRARTQFEEEVMRKAAQLAKSRQEAEAKRKAEKEKEDKAEQAKNDVNNLHCNQQLRRFQKNQPVVQITSSSSSSSSINAGMSGASATPTRKAKTTANSQGSMNSSQINSPQRNENNSSIIFSNKKEEIQNSRPNPNSLLFHDTTRIRLQSRPALQDSTFNLPTKSKQTRLKQSNSFRSVSTLTLRPREPPPPPPVAGGKPSFASTVQARLQKSLSTNTLLSKSTEKLNLNSSKTSHYGPGGKLLPSKAQISLPLGFTTTSKAAGLLAGSVEQVYDVAQAAEVQTKEPKKSIYKSNTKHSAGTSGVKARLSKSSTNLANRSKSLTDRCEALEKVLSEQREKDDPTAFSPLRRSTPALNTAGLSQNPLFSLPKDDIDSKNIEIVTKENAVSEIRIYSATSGFNIHPTENLPYQGIIYEATRTIITAEPSPPLPPPNANSNKKVESGPTSPEIHYAATDLFQPAVPPHKHEPPQLPQRQSGTANTNSRQPFSHPPLPPVPASPKSVDSPGKSVVLVIDNSGKGKSKGKAEKAESSLPAYSQPIDTITGGNTVGAVPPIPNRALPPQIPLPSIPASVTTAAEGACDPDDLGEPLYDDVINHSATAPITKDSKSEKRYSAGSLGRKSIGSLISPPHRELPPLPPPPVPPHRTPPPASSPASGQVLSSTLPCLACPPSLPPPNLPSKSLSEFQNRPLILQESEEVINHGFPQSLDEEVDNLYNDIGMPALPQPNQGSMKSSTAAAFTSMKDALLGAITKQKDFDKRSVLSNSSTGSSVGKELIYDDTLSVISSSSFHKTRLINQQNQQKSIAALTQQSLPLPPTPPEENLPKEEDYAENEPLYDDVLNISAEQEKNNEKNKKENSEYHSSNASDSGTEDLPPPLPAQGPPTLPKGGADLLFPLLNALPIPSEQSQEEPKITQPVTQSSGKEDQSKEVTTKTLFNELNEKLSKLNFSQGESSGENSGNAQSSTSPGSSSLSSTAGNGGEGQDSFNSFHISKVVISPSSESSGVEEDYNSEKNYSLSNGSDATSSGSDNENYTKGSNASSAAHGPASAPISLARGKFLENMKLSMLSSMGSTVGSGLLMMSTTSTTASISSKNSHSTSTLAAEEEEDEPIYEEIGEHQQKKLEKAEDDEDDRSASPIYADAFDAKSMFDGASRSEILSFLESIRDRLTGAESQASSSESQSSSISRSSTATKNPLLALTVDESEEILDAEEERENHEEIKESPEQRVLCPDCNDDIPLAEQEKEDFSDRTENTGVDFPEEANLNSTRASSTSNLCCRSCNRKRNEKKEIIMEIYETELKYGRDLRIISEEFYKPIQIAGLLTKEQLDQIFLNVEELIQLNLELTGRLKAAIQKASSSIPAGQEHFSQQEIAGMKNEESLEAVNVGRIFIELGETMMSAFESYCTRQASAGALLSQLEKEKELLRIFLRVSQMENTVLRRMNLPAFLMVPVQRVTRYPLLLARLLKVTPVDHFSREELQSAQEKIEQHLEHMNKTTREVASVKLWRRISIINSSSNNSQSNGPAHRRSNSDLDTSNIRIRKMAMDVLDWTNFSDVTCVIDTPLGCVHFNGKALRNIYGCVLARGKDMEALGLKIQDQDPFFPPAEDVVKDVKLVLVRVKNTRFCLLREPLCLSKCVVSQGENEFQEFIEINEITTKNTYFIQALDKQGTSAWLKFLQCYSSCVGHWRRRRPALANIMMNGMIKHL